MKHQKAEITNTFISHTQILTHCKNYSPCFASSRTKYVCQMASVPTIPQSWA